MRCRLWDCLPLSQQQLLFDYQTGNHDKNWEPPKQYFSRNVTTPFTPSPISEAAKVMEATPGQVKANLGVFAERV